VYERDDENECKTKNNRIRFVELREIPLSRGTDGSRKRGKRKTEKIGLYLKRDDILCGIH
jgi:hypothetical protein